MKHIAIAASLVGVVIATSSRGAADYERQEQAIRAIGPEFVADARGTAYVADSSGARIIEFQLQPKAR